MRFWIILITMSVTGAVIAAAGLDPVPYSAAALLWIGLRG